MRLTQIDEAFSNGYGWQDTPYSNVNVKSKPLPDPMKEVTKAKKKAKKHK